MTGVKRHPIRGFFGGLFLGLGIAQLLIVFKVVVLGSVVPAIVVIVVTVLGVVWALYGPVRGGGRAKKADAPATT
jgi:hypothetical protein